MRRLPLLLLLALLSGAAAHAQPVDGGCDPASPDTAYALATDLGDATGFALRGPVPDFDAMSGIVVHENARRISQPLFTALNEAIGEREVVSGFGSAGRSSYTDPNLVWMRDYHPLYVRKADGLLKVVTYLSVNPQRMTFTGASYVPVPPPDASKKLYKIPGDPGPGRWLETAEMPILLEAGNVLSTGRHVFLTEKVIEDNAKAWSGATHLARHGYKARSREEVVAELAKALEVPPENVVILPSIPGEKTKHVDLELLALGPNEVMVPEIRDEAIAAIGYGHEIALAGEAKAKLDAVAATVAEKGYTVTRLPMMPAVFLAPNIPPGVPLAALGGRDPGWAGTYYSPANSLLVNVAGKKTAIFPTWNPRGFPDGYRALDERYRGEWADAFRARGWEPKGVDATDLGRASGLFRCISFPIPQ